MNCQRLSITLAKSKSLPIFPQRTAQLNTAGENPHNLAVRSHFKAQIVILKWARNTALQSSCSFLDHSLSCFPRRLFLSQSSLLKCLAPPPPPSSLSAKDLVSCFTEKSEAFRKGKAPTTTPLHLLPLPIYSTSPPVTVGELFTQQAGDHPQLCFLCMTPISSSLLGNIAPNILLSLFCIISFPFLFDFSHQQTYRISVI